MKIPFFKYQALGNSFLVVELKARYGSRRRLSELARTLCSPKWGIGADGVLFLSRQSGVDRRIEVCNADGGWAEKSGNGLRIAAVHMADLTKTKRQFSFFMGGRHSDVRLIRKSGKGWMVEAELGVPDFRAKRVPVRSRHTYVVNSELKVAGEIVRGTCLSVGNPHCVIVVPDLAFDWQPLGRAIEVSPLFPQRTNVEFVQRVSRRKLKVAGWERGAGATGSSGSGAAAAVCAMVMQGLADRQCEVRFETGSLFVDWREDDGTIHLTGPVQFVTRGDFDWQ